MLIVMHHGDVGCFCNPPFNFETLRGFDVFKVNPSKGLSNVDNRIDEGFWIFCIHFNVKHIDIARLSGGQRQRAVIARALASEAEFILLDEPLVGIDREARNSLLKLLDGLCHHQGKTILMVSHDLAAIRQTAHRMIFLEETIRFDGDTEKFPDLVELADLRGIGPVHGHAHHHPIPVGTLDDSSHIHEEEE